MNDKKEKYTKEVVIGNKVANETLKFFGNQKKWFQYEVGGDCIAQGVLLAAFEMANFVSPTEADSYELIQSTLKRYIKHGES